ncbi:hypothetical protein ACFSO7_22435 [Bacillus sp. CGMCC 1.16607]|uniref:hypothetical protein n=1 Tax=Bacillus sp. CGMCC 1.16607 TaxID=3351842 RepID=UPI00363932F3
MIVIKVNEVPNSREGLKERTRRAWRINPARLYNQDTLIAVYKGEILEEYKVLGYGQDEIETDRVAFDLEEVPNSKFKGQKIEYKTSNPCTLVDPSEFGLVELHPNFNKQYRFVEPKIQEKQLTEALEKGLGRSLDDREKRYIKWHSENDYEASGLLLDWFIELTEKGEGRR